MCSADVFLTSLSPFNAQQVLINRQLNSSFLSFTLQSSVYNWVKVHRVHHKFAETVKDPLNFRRGFFFAHVGWYCLSYHPACEKEMQRIDLTDIKADKDIMFQYK